MTCSHNPGIQPQTSCGAVFLGTERPRSSGHLRRRAIFRIGFALLPTAFLVLMVFCAGKANSLPSSLAPGQVWTIRTPSPTPIRVVIVRLEPWHNKIVAHVSIIDIPIPQGLPGAGGLTRIDHMPFDETALMASLRTLVGERALPAPHFEDGYRQWKAARGGIFTVSVPDAIKFVLGTIR